MGPVDVRAADDGGSGDVSRHAAQKRRKVPMDGTSDDEDGPARPNGIRQSDGGGDHGPDAEPERDRRQSRQARL